MIIDTKTDMHVHTSRCNHAVGTMEQYVQEAIRKGLKRMVFLEHLEEEISYSYRTWLTEEDFDDYFAEGEALQKRYHDEIEILLGVEVGYNPECPQRLLTSMAGRSWDWIGLSYHFFRVPGSSHHLNLLSSSPESLDAITRYGTATALSHYLDTLTQAAGIIPANMLCHLDAGLSFHPDITFTQHHRSQVDQLLHTLRDRNMALEINTSGLAKRSLMFPAPWILDRARDLNVTLVASSDAHAPAQVGRFFSQIDTHFNQPPFNA
jgi:histidinol-phosphatase (PHP family)